MTLDLTGILCSVMMLSPSVREGALAFLFAKTNTSYLPSQATPNTADSPMSDLLLPQSCRVSTGKLTTWWAVQVPLLREGNMEKAKRDT